MTHTVSCVGTTGLIFTAIAAAWLAYLIPLYLRRRDDQVVVEEDPSNRFSDSMRIVKHGTAPLLDQDLAEIDAVEISTPLTRRAAIDDLRRLEKQAAGRRRRVLVSLMALLTGVVAAWGVGLIDWWWIAVPAGLLLAFVVVARFSVRVMRRGLDARYDAIMIGGTESTVFLSRVDLNKSKPALALTATNEPVSKPGALWDPIPVTLPTYVSKPLAPRTVRTIDLSGPEVTSSGRSAVPVTADAPHVEAAGSPVAEGPVISEMPRAAGE